MSEESETPNDPREVISRMDELADEMMEVNATIIRKARQVARNMAEIQMMHLQQAERAFEIAQMAALGAKMTSDLMGDLVTSEWDLDEMLAQEYGLNRNDDDDDDEEEEGDE